MKQHIEQIRQFLPQPKYQLLILQIAAVLSIFHFAFASLEWSAYLLIAVKEAREYRTHEANYSGFLPMTIPIGLSLIFAFVLWQSKKNLKNAARLFAAATLCAFALLVYDVRHDNYQMSGEDLRGGPRCYEYFTWPIYSSLDYEYRKRFTH